jgi:ubiquinone/menaquinone biosynthesis C-methylase UbiE
LSSLSGHVLEVGVGTGANLPFYPRNVRVTGVDFSSGMLQYARNVVQQLCAEDRMTLLEMDVQQMTFPDDSFDYIVSTCVFCSVPDPVQGLHELRRVCKSDGKILMLEHMRSENAVAGILMDLLNPLTVRLWGANINRRTMDNIARAGLTIEKDKQLFGTILRRLEVAP